MNAFQETVSEQSVFCQPTGEKIKIKRHRLSYGLPGPHIYLQASVHGAELQGNMLLNELYRYAKKNQFNGTIDFVPLANPLGTSSKVGHFTAGRFNLATGGNFNRFYINLSKVDGFNPQKISNENSESQDLKRAFKNHLQELLKQQNEKEEEYGVREDRLLPFALQKWSLEADIVLDLHTGANATRYLYSSEWNFEKSKDLGFPFTIVIPNEFDGAMDEASFVPWYHLSKLRDVDFEAYTLELGGEERINSEEAKEDWQKLSHFLYKRGVFNENFEPPEQDLKFSKLENLKTYHASVGGLYEFHQGPGIPFDRGQILATGHNFPDQQSEVRAKKDGVILNAYPSAIVRKGQYLFQILEQLSSSTD